jgi:hypothetical protein
MNKHGSCLFCKATLHHVFIDLGTSPPSNDFVKEENLALGEIYYPLKVFVCQSCWLVQLAEYKKAEALFGDEYVYFSSYSKAWLKHSENYTKEVIKRFALHEKSFVVELASNDGYLLQYIKQAGIPCLGIEPTASTAQAARERGIETISKFFGQNCARELLKLYPKPNLMIANNVLAHVPRINDFVGGIKTMLASDGVFTAEFPHLLRLIKENQFDTIYHEHFSYYSLFTMQKILNKNGLQLFDVQTLPTHGGSLRIYADHGQNKVTDSVDKILQEEIYQGIDQLKLYEGFQQKAEAIKIDLLAFLVDARKKGKTVAGYGAAAKGNTLLNYCGVKKDLLSYVVDASPYKQSKYLPGSRIPVYAEDRIKQDKPDYVLILPWNLKEEIADQLDYIRDWGGKFIISIPGLQIF